MDRLDVRFFANPDTPFAFPLCPPSCRPVPSSCRRRPIAHCSLLSSSVSGVFMLARARVVARITSSCASSSSNSGSSSNNSITHSSSSVVDLLLLRGRRPLSSKAAASKSQTKDAASVPVVAKKKGKGDAVEKVKKPRAAAPNPVGKLYHELLHRSRGANQLALGDLRKLLEQCKGPDELKYASHAVALYQRKGQDFSEEVNSHFISACIRGGQPVVAAAELAKYACRIGAWTTPVAFERLAASLEAQGQARELIPGMLHKTCFQDGAVV